MINPIIKAELLNSDKKAELIRKIVPPTSKIIEIANMNPQDSFLLLPIVMHRSTV
jgi:hypothetical protein